MDMSQLSDSDLAQIAKGDMRMVSEKGLRILAGEAATARPSNDTGTLTNMAAGALRGAADIGATILTPVAAVANAIGGKGTMLTGAERRKSFGEFFNDNANPDDLSFKAGQLAANVAGTAGVGGVLAKGAMAIPAIARLAPALPAALQSGGMSLGNVAANTGREVLKNAATRVAGGAITGGASAGLVNPDDAGTGALIGGILPGVVRGAAEIGKSAKAALYDPLFNQGKIIAGTLQRAVGSDAIPSIMNSLGTKAATPGVNLSAGQATLDPALNAIEDALRSSNSGGMLNRQAINQRQALSGSMRGLAQDDIALEAAKQARKDAAEELYRKALDPANQQELTPWLKGQITQLVKRPSINEASKTAQKWAIERGEKPTAEGSLTALHDVKTALDDMIAKATIAGEGGQVKALKSTQAQLLNVLEKISPDYQNARRTYATMSAPINQMQVGQTLANKLIPSTAGDIPATLNAASLATALRNPDQVARTATGFSGAALEKVLTPEQLAMVNGVSSDASRIAEAAKLGAGFGSPTARRLATGGYVGEHIADSSPVMSNIISSLGGLPGVNYLTKGASTVGNMAGKRINADIAAKLEEALANNPDELRNLLTMRLAQSQPGMIGGLLSSSPIITIAATRAGLLAQ